MEPIMAKSKYITRTISNLKDLLEQTVALYSDNEAFIKKTKDVYVGVTYKKYKEDVFALGTELLKLNIKNERIIILTESRYEAAVSIMATVCGGGIIVPLSVSLSYEELISKINLIKAKGIIFSEKYRETIKKVKEKCSTITFGINLDSLVDDEDNFSFLRLIETGNRTVLNGDNGYAKLEIDNENIAVILFSNKNLPVALSHKNFTSEIMAFSSVFPLQKNDKTFCSIDFSDIYELTYTLFTMNYQGGTVGFLDNYESLINATKIVRPSVLFFNENTFDIFFDEILKEFGDMPKLRKIKVTIFISNILRKLNFDLRYKFFKNVYKIFGDELKNILICSEKIKLDKVKFLNNIGIKSFYGYGMIETTGLFSLNDIDSQKEKSIGVPLPDVEVTVIKHNGKEHGEILVKGNTVIKEYYNDKKETSKYIKNGTLYTGNIGYRDRKGYFVFTGIKKNKRSKR